jgi:hypothetical protein
MHIVWGSLGVVFLVSFAAAVMVVVLVSVAPRRAVRPLGGDPRI